MYIDELWLEQAATVESYLERTISYLSCDAFGRASLAT